MKKSDFAGLLCSRLCHDLVSPVGAINNGVELLTDKNNADMQDQIVDLIQDSAGQTTNKLQFFRLAFGLGGGFGATISIDEARTALSGVFDQNKIQVSWDVNCQSLPKELMKIVLNVALIAGEAIIGLGSVNIQIAENDGHHEIAVKASGGRLIVQESIRKAISEDFDSVEGEPKSVPMLMARLIAMENGLSINLSEKTEGEITFSLV